MGQQIIDIQFRFTVHAVCRMEQYKNPRFLRQIAADEDFLFCSAAEMLAARSYIFFLQMQALRANGSIQLLSPADKQTFAARNRRRQIHMQ